MTTSIGDYILLVLINMVHLLVLAEAFGIRNKAYLNRTLPIPDGRIPTTAWFEDILLDGYEKRDPPSEFQDHPVMVKLGIYLNSFDAISEQSMDYSINIYLREEWNDPRLKFTPFPGKGKQVLKLADYMWDKLWVPDVFFRNEKQAQFHYVTRPNRLMRLYEDGTVYYASKITTTLACPMKLHKYPLDTQICPLQIESFGYTSDVLLYKWREKTVEMEDELILPQFKLIKYILVDCSQNYSTGYYPCLQIDFILKRSIGYYMIQIYIPSVMIVILSWVAFWISIDAIPARVTIGLLTVLTMTTQSAGARQQLPRVSYIKALDVWMSVCLVFVFSSLLEFAVVNVFSRKEIRRYMRHLHPMDDEKAISERCSERVSHNKMVRMMGDSGGGQRGGMPMMRDNEARARANMIDKLSRKLFPLAFVVFNVVYWVSYILW
ncbi:glycine receptor subunit alpha-2-like isoform X2 [Lineus longissimus]|uniref:glycine receptor subunit alpha-2-like isoform X2 n=1 Tax=Lineus longissimus TaxID=88925 RepID=UPI00315CD097